MALAGTKDTKALRFAAAPAACLFLLLVFVLSSCGSGGEDVRSSGEKESPKEAEKAEKSFEKEKLPEDEKMMMEERGKEKEPLPKSGSAGGQAKAKSGAVEAGIPEGADAQSFDRRIINSAELGILSEDVRDSAARAQQVAARAGGSVLSSEINQEGDGGSVSADLVLSVPSESFEEVLEELRELGTEVTTDTVEGEDVTEEFVDLEARERNLLAAEESLVELYEQSQSVDDTLAVQRELTNIRGQIERVQGRIEYLEQRTDFSQIALGIQSAAGATEGRPAWDPAGVAAGAWDASLRFLQALANAVITVFAFGWWLIPLLILGLAWWWRRQKKRDTSPGKDSS